MRGGGAAGAGLVHPARANGPLEEERVVKNLRRRLTYARGKAEKQAKEHAEGVISLTNEKNKLRDQLKECEEAWDQMMQNKDEQLLEMKSKLFWSMSNLSHSESKIAQLESRLEDRTVWFSKSTKKMKARHNERVKKLKSEVAKVKEETANAIARGDESKRKAVQREAETG